MSNLRTIVECPRCKQERLCVFDDMTAKCEHVTVQAYPAYQEGLLGRTHPPYHEHVPCGFTARVVSMAAHEGLIDVVLAYKVFRPNVTISTEAAEDLAEWRALHGTPPRGI